MLDISVAYNRYKFLGNEYLTWLWFVLEMDQGKVKDLEEGPVSLEIGNRLVLENRKDHGVEIVTIKGDDAGLEEGMLALRKGAVVTEMNLLLKAGDEEWRFTIKGESFHFVGLKAPATGVVESREDLEGAVLEKASLCERATRCMDRLFKAFIVLRVSDDWSNKVVPRIRKWMYA